MVRQALNRVSAIALLAALGSVIAAPASAVPSYTTFNFNANDPTGISCACNGGDSTAIASYMTSWLTSVGFSNVLVTVSGAVGQMGPANPSGSNTNGSYFSYSGDGNVVEDPYHVRPLTLGDTEALPSATTTPGGTYYDSMPSGYTNWNAGSGTPNSLNSTNDGYIKNCTGTDGANCSPQADHFTLKFQTKVGANTYDYLTDSSGQKYLISGLKTDYEIFPDANCASSGSCSETPDLEIYSGLAASGGTLLATYLGTNPGAGAYSPAGPNPETAFQAIGVTPTLNVAGNGNNLFDFVDWPATIGIDNLKVTFNQVPELPAILMFVLGLFAIGGVVRYQRARPAAQ